MQFHILSFEGHDPYACAGGLASRINGLVRTLAEVGFETHLWFVGDPQLSGHETQGQLHLHRWCQWISQYHPGGVYDGEEGSVWTMRRISRHFVTSYFYLICCRGSVPSSSLRNGTRSMLYSIWIGCCV